jgi:hypothetical protein
MGKAQQEPQVVHKHYHLLPSWPDADCGCFMAVGVIAICIAIYALGVVKALPWQ